MNFEVITVMFEELKTLLLTISKKLDNKEVTPQRAEPTDTSKIEEMIRHIEKPNISKVEQMVGTMVEIYEKTLNVTLHQNDKISKSLTALQERETVAPPPQRHLHTVELKSSKVVIALVSLSFALFASLISNLYQWRENGILSDSDIKYRYIKAHQGIGKNDLHTLETIFKYEPDTKKTAIASQMGHGLRTCRQGPCSRPRTSQAKRGGIRATSQRGGRTQAKKITL